MLDRNEKDFKAPFRAPCSACKGCINIGLRGGCKRRKSQVMALSGQLRNCIEQLAQSRAETFRLEALRGGDAEALPRAPIVARLGWPTIEAWSQWENRKNQIVQFLLHNLQLFVFSESPLNHFKEIIRSCGEGGI